MSALDRHRSIRATLSAALFAGLLTFKFVGAARAEAAGRLNNDRPVGVVVAIRPHSVQEPGAILVRRSSDTERRLNEGDLVYANDEVIVPHRDASVMISQSRGNIIVCPEAAASDPCRQQLGNAGYLNAVGKFYDSVKRLIAQSRDRIGNAATLSTRSSSIEALSISGSKTQIMSSGQRTIWLNWLGGEPPFKISLRSPSREIASVLAEHRNASLGPVQLAIGAHSLTVRDNTGLSLVIPLKVVDMLPKPVESLPLPPNLSVRQFFVAAWLSQHDRGRFRLEAIQQLRAIEADMPVAGALKTELLLGEP